MGNTKCDYIIKGKERNSTTLHKDVKGQALRDPNLKGRLLGKDEDAQREKKKRSVFGGLEEHPEAA